MPRRNVVESFPVSFSESRIRKPMKGTTCPVCSYSRVRTAASADCLCSGTQRQRRVGTLWRAAEVRARRLRAAEGGRRDGRTQSARREHAPRRRSRAATVPCTFKFPSTGQLKNRQAEQASKREGREGGACEAIREGNVQARVQRALSPVPTTHQSKAEKNSKTCLFISHESR